MRYLRCPVENPPSVAELQLLVPQAVRTHAGPRAATACRRTAAPGARDAGQHGGQPARRERTRVVAGLRLFQDSFFRARLARLLLSELGASLGSARAADLAAGEGDLGGVIDRQPAATDGGRRRMRLGYARTLTPPPESSPHAGFTLSFLDAVGTPSDRGDGRLILQLNSYENRVFQVFLEDAARRLQSSIAGPLEDDADPRGTRSPSSSLAGTRCRSSPWAADVDARSRTPNA